MISLLTYEQVVEVEDEATREEEEGEEHLSEENWQLDGWKERSCEISERTTAVDDDGDDHKELDEWVWVEAGHEVDGKSVQQHKH